MPKSKTVYVCSSCGGESLNWAGKCPRCGEWNTLKEIQLADTKKSSAAASSALSRHSARKLEELDASGEIRFSTGISEFDRVLGGGAVEASLVLVGGAPGIGKSTLLLQMCSSCDGVKNILYVSGEESERQIKLRARRIGVNGERTWVLPETDIDAITASCSELRPDILIIDSIQTMCDRSNDSIPGSISQVRECTNKILRLAKENGITVFIVGHINKEGSIAGPKVLEHMVDCVLYFEGESNTSLRLLRAIKNRFGSTNEIGVFEMVDNGLKCVENPSEMLLSGRPVNSSGTCVTCVMEGSRPLLAEIQALVNPANYNPARRVNGADFNRVAMLCAVLEKRSGIKLNACDVYVNVIGGLSIDEPSADLAIALSVVSGERNIVIPADMAALGEIGLSGEIRNVSDINKRLSEISRLGFRKCLIPSHIRGELNSIPGLELLPVKNINDAIRTLSYCR